MDIDHQSITVKNKFTIGLDSIVGVLDYRGHTILVLKSGNVFEFSTVLHGYLQRSSGPCYFDGVLDSLWHREFISCVTLTPYNNKNHEFNVVTARFNDGKVVSLRLKPEVVEFQKTVLFPSGDAFGFYGLINSQDDAPTTDEGWMVQ